jgi:hypothetical protein
MRVYIHEIRRVGSGITQQEPYVETLTFTNKSIVWQDGEANLQDLKDACLETEKDRITQLPFDFFQIKYSLRQKKSQRFWFTFSCE